MNRRHYVAAVSIAAILTQLAAGPMTSPSSAPTVAFASSFPCPTPATAASTVRSGTPSPTPLCGAAADALLKSVEQELGKSVAELLRTEAQLEASLHASAFEDQQLSSLISAADQKIAALDAEIDRLQAQIDATTARIEVERAQIATLARIIYAQPDSVLLLVIRSQSLREAVTKTSVFMVAGLRAQEQKTRLADDLNRLQVDQDKVQADHDQQEHQKQVLEGLTQRSLALQTRALAIADQLRVWVDQIRAELELVTSQSPAVAAQVQARLVSRTPIIIGEAHRLTSDHIRLLLLLPAQAKQQGANMAMQAPPPPTTGRARLAWPLANAVLTQGFGPSSLWLEPPFAGFPHFHTGIDLAAPLNSPVLAAAGGTVAVVGRDTWGYGNYAVIAHGNGLATLYAHMNSVSVGIGESVRQGQQVGLEGSTGTSTGPHLHFEVRSIGLPVNPLPYLDPTNA